MSKDPKNTPAIRDVGLQQASADTGLATRGQQDVRRGAPVPLAYTHREGFACLEEARDKLSAEFRYFLRSEVESPEPDNWYCETQTYTDRMEATVLLVGPDRLFIAQGTRPLEPAGRASGGKPRMKFSGDWTMEYVRLPFVEGTVKSSQFRPSPQTVPGGRSDYTKGSSIEQELSNLPFFVQHGIHNEAPPGKRLRERSFAIGPPVERFWLFVTSVDRLTFVHARRTIDRHFSGLDVADPASHAWYLRVITAGIGPATAETVEFGSGWRPPTPDPKRSLTAVPQSALALPERLKNWRKK